MDTFISVHGIYFTVKMSVTKLTTWNVKGINDVAKRRNILSSLKKEGAHIAFFTRDPLKQS